MTPNYGLAPSSERCWVCRHVAHPEDVTVRLIGSEGQNLKLAPAMDYIRSIGIAAEDKDLRRYLMAHRAHVRKAMAPDAVIIPAHRTLGVQRLEPGDGSPTWIRAPDRAIDLGLSAMESLQAQLGELEPAELMQLARLGVSAAAKVGDWHAKGRQLDQFDDLMKATFEANRAPRDD